MSREHSARTINGFFALLMWFGLVALTAWRIHYVATTHDVSAVWQPIALGLTALVALGGFLVIQPNEGRVLLLFGRYIGSVTAPGFHYANPFAGETKVSLRVHNFNSEKLKVNDARGNPIEIAAVVVWKVTSSARALLEVEDYKGFVAIQSETAIRSVAGHFPYDTHEGEHSLRGSPEEVTAELMKEVQERLEVAGVQVIDARLSHLAYAQEIAHAMLRRQQAEAVVAARRQIVEGAVSMVEMGLHRLEESGVVKLDEERKAAMINNLLVALVSDRESQPVINTGSLY
ncbi:MAG: SPFH domain-containing protein [Nannocystaceae bacterium]